MTSLLHAIGILLLVLEPLAANAYHVPARQHLFNNAPSSEVEASRIPTIYESAVLARRILRLEDIGTLSTVFPHRRASSTDGIAAGTDEDVHDAHAGEDPIWLAESSIVPDGLEGSPIGLMDYFGDCEPKSGNPTILSVSIATSFRNEAAGSNISLAVRWRPYYADRRPYSEASMPRFSVIGYLEDMSSAEVERQDIQGCFAGYHPDAVIWYPGNGIHESRWARLVVTKIYWIGGFGDRAYIGWIPVEEWRKVTEEDIERARLPGEHPPPKANFEL